LKINLKELEIRYINLPTYVNRNQSMINMLNYYGLKASRIEGIPRGIYKNYDIIADSHRKALNSSSAEQVLILEDDCIPHNYRQEFEVPDDADIIYLGLHTYGHPVERVSEEIWRVSGMAGAHAILYLTQRGKDILIQAQKLSRTKKHGFDISLGKLQHKVNTYALNSPIWYQGDLPDLTKFNADDSEIVPDYYGGFFSDYDDPVVFDSKSGLI
jgi:hypothetical protein